MNAGIPAVVAGASDSMGCGTKFLPDALPTGPRASDYSGSVAWDGVIQSFMTSSVLTVDVATPLEQAREIMREHDIRHLPVIDGFRLVGVITQRDLEYLETIPSLELSMMSAGEAASDNFYEVDPGTPMAHVAKTMAERKFDIAVVTNGYEVLGIFTTVDALRTMARLLEG